MIEKAINKILSLAPAVMHTIEGRRYVDGPDGFKPILSPTPQPLEIHTLQGIVHYIDKSIDKTDEQDIFIHVISPTDVRLLGSLNKGGFYERCRYLVSNFNPPDIPFNRYASLEDFIIVLQAYFVPTENIAAMLKIVGNIKDESVKQFSDDGVTQSVTAKAGISRVESVTVPNPVMLHPYRTFPEVEQPESSFLFRMKQNPGSMPSCGIWEADNKKWEIEAIKNIAEWLYEKLPDIPIVA